MGLSARDVAASGAVVVAGMAVGVAVATVAGGALPVPTRWDRGSVQLLAFVCVVALGLLLRAVHTPSEASTARWLSLRDVAPTPAATAMAGRFIPRTRFARTAGGVIGAFAFLVPSTLTSFVEGAVQTQLVDGVQRLPGNLLFLTGYAIGAVVAELLPRTSRSGERRRAELSPRDVTAYVWWFGRFGPPALAVIAALLWALAGGGSGALSGMAGWSPALGVAATIVVAVCSETAYRLIVERRQAAPEPAAIAADDAARASSAHAVAGAALALQLMLVASGLRAYIERWALPDGGPPTALWVLGTLLHMAAFGVWLAFGTSFVWTVSRRSHAAQPT